LQKRWYNVDQGKAQRVNPSDQHTKLT
jgi:hypothetical protein